MLIINVYIVVVIVITVVVNYVREFPYIQTQ